MDLRYLKKIRIVLSIIFFLSILLLFFDLSFSIQSSFSDYPLYLQFIPAFLKIFSVGIIGGLGFFIVILLTLLFGRVYCSTICPLGILQDFILFVRKKVKKINFYFSDALIRTRYIFLIIPIVFFLFGIALGFNLLDPYSNFGRIINNIFRPILIFINNIAALILEYFNAYLINPIAFQGVEYFSLTFSLIVLLLIIWLSAKYGRLFCNSVCPVGTFLGLISKFSFFKIEIDESSCIFCSECETVCKSSCIDSESQVVDFSRCVGCFNCVDICASGGITYKSRYKLNESGKLNFSKRDFFKNIGIFALGSNLILKAQKKIEVYKPNKTPVIRETPVSPPGSISVDNFNDHCTACHLCVASCPTQVLQPSFLEYGILEIMQPRMDYKSGFCNFECNICTEVCPSGAIQSTQLESKKRIQLGKAIFVKDNCVVYTQKTDCGACAEHCPTKAVKMVFDETVKLKAPKVDDKICVGCGACEFACPTFPYKAIYVEGNPNHLLADKPDKSKLEEQIDLKEDFPF